MVANSLQNYLEQKGQEYAFFDPMRARRVYRQLSSHIDLSKSKKIHILGTNGKGSTGRYLAILLREEGYRILHFTSPHIFSFHERFYKNDGILSDEELQRAHTFLQNFDFIQQCSYFEYATFLALVLAQDVDFLIMEAGLGGEFDSTSVLTYDLDIFTYIGLDHQDILGKNLKQIAFTKLAAMSKKAILAVGQHHCVYSIAKKIAKQKRAKIKFLTSGDLQRVANLTSHLPDFLAQNAWSAISAFEQLLDKTPTHLPELNLMGRMQKITPNIYIDVGHNIGAAKAIREVLQKEGIEKVVLVYNSYYDKNIFKILQILAPKLERVEILEVKNPRIISREKLASILDSLKLESRMFSKIENEKYLVFGSFSVVEEFMKLYQKRTLNG